MPLINSEVNIIFTWSANFVVVYTNVANNLPKIKDEAYVINLDK